MELFYLVIAHLAGNITVYYCGFIVVTMGIVYFQFRTKITPIIKELKLCNQKLRVHDGEQQFTENYYEFAEFLENTKYLRNRWHEFSEVLLMPETDFDSGNICNTKQPQLYFSQHSILWHRMNMRFYNAFPNFLTGLGIIGTFVGLVWGISNAAPGLSGDMEQSKAALSGLLSGASLAFYTSIAGLVSSIIFSFLEKKLVHKFDTCLNLLNGGLEARLEFISVEKIVSATLREARKQTDSLESFSNDLAISLGEILEQRITVPFNASMRVALSEAKKQTESLQDLPGTFGDILDERVTQPMSETMGGLQQVMEGVREDQQRASDETLERLIAEFSKTITGAAGKEMDAFASTMETLSNDLQNQMNVMAKNHQDMQDSSHQALKDANESFAQGSKQIKDDISFTISSMLEGVSESTAQMMRMLRDATSESATNMKNVAGQFEGTASVLEKTMTDLSTVGEQTQSLMADISSLLQAVKISQENLTASVEPLVNVAKDMKATSDNFHSSATVMTESSLKLSQTIETLKEIQDDMQNAWVGFAERFEGVDHSLAKMFKEFEFGFESYAKNTNNYIVELDKHASKVVSSLAGATNEFDDRIQDLSDALNQDGIDNLVKVTENLIKYIEELGNYSTNVTSNIAQASEELGGRISNLDQVLSEADLSSFSNATDSLTNYANTIDKQTRTAIERLVEIITNLDDQISNFNKNNKSGDSTVSNMESQLPQVLPDIDIPDTTQGN